MKTSTEQIKREMERELGVQVTENFLETLKLNIERNLKKKGKLQRTGVYC